MMGLLELFQGKISLSEILTMDLPLLKELQISKIKLLTEQQKEREKMQREQEAKMKQSR